MANLNKASQFYVFRNVWTSDARMLFKDEKNPSGKPVVCYNGFF